MIKNNKGITMVTLIITIVIILIISGVTIYQSVEDIKVRKIDSLYTDLELLEDKVNTYYLTYGTIPIKEEFKGSENFKTVRNVNDNNVYYVIDISLLDGVSLNMKLDFTGDDVYIMNEQSHTVYYPKGLTIDNETYYTLPKQYSKIMTNEPSVDDNGLADKDTIIKAKDDPDIQIVIPEGFAPVILQTDRTDSMPGENGAVKELMPVEEWANITSDQINKGIVVVDNVITYDGGNETGTVSDFNEYVWVPMPDMSKFSRVAWTTSYDELNNIVSGGYTHVLSENSAIKSFWEDKTSIEYINMLNSVSINKGFYISRYEASQKNSMIAQSKRGQNPWVDVSQTTSITASKNMNTSINSHLIYGIEWDSILMWVLDTKAAIGADTSGIKTITIDDIQTNSSSWGNYRDSVGEAATNSGNLQIGGCNEYWKVNNIYDLAGNVREWTQEKYTDSDNNVTYAIRGGNFDYKGNYYTVVLRNPVPEDYTRYAIRF